MDITRRTFLKIAGAGAAAAGPRKILAIFEDGSMIVQDHRVPVEKGLSAEWKKSLFERGTKEVWSGEALDSIGMPIGGIAAGQLYLCGDGTLGHWEIFNTHEFLSYGATNYAKREVKRTVKHGAKVSVTRSDSDGTTTQTRTLTKGGFESIEFIGQYPMAVVNYEDDDFAIKIRQSAYSPFIPLNAKDSALPAIVLEYELTNTSDEEATVLFETFLENAVGRSAEKNPGDRKRHSIPLSDDGLTIFNYTCDPAKPEFGDDAPDPRPAILLHDFEGDSYGEWVSTGNSFGTDPAKGTLVNQNRVTGFEGRGLVNTYLNGDGTIGTLASPTFTIQRKFINFKIGGGNHPGRECMNLVVDGKIVRTATGLNDERLLWETWDVSEFEGKQAQLVIVDTATGGWGHINIDHIEMADRVRSREDVNTRRGDPNRDTGTMALAVLESAGLSGGREHGFDDEFIGSLMVAPVQLKAGETRKIVAVLAWHFPNHPRGRQYSNWFKDAEDVVRYVHKNYERLSPDTRKWVKTFYDSTLPYWLLDRLGSTVGNLATGTTEWWGNGRFWAWEGVVCCAGTCTHVWNYEHAMARLWPELEVNIRERQDFGQGFHPETGLVGFRSDAQYAADGQCGTILKAYREHTMQKDASFLKKNWPSIKKAMQFSISHDPDKDGIIADSQHNTYDINFEGPNTFVGALYLAALRAAEEMAKEVGDDAFAIECRTIFEQGTTATMQTLWNGEYFIQRVDAAKHPQHQYGPGCLADQMFGQGWAHHVGLGYLYPKESVKKALESVWKYCWAPDIAPQNARWKPERPFAVPGEAGLFICTWPKGERPNEPVRYRDEVWTGIEYQVAGHMIWEGLVEEGLAICKAVHERYHPIKRNPYNEVECSDHYARALASWGVYTALAGFDYHGPRAYLKFDPKITPRDFKAAFTTAEGWGSYSQKVESGVQNCTIEVAHGKVVIGELHLRPVEGHEATSISVGAPGEIVMDISTADGFVVLKFGVPLEIQAGRSMSVSIGSAAATPLQ
jgi:non-lysosomal glucosylceramidase